mmetsp:Transcript_19763/g.49715  ORF Transcript_19763/g.49715 Transcript_19763/m.49715 type:complete len:305 (-) Transcript_19763:992-1906(-)
MRSPNPRSNSLEAQRYYSGASRTTMAGGLGAAVSSPLQNRGGLNRSGSMAGNLQPSKGATPNPNRPHAYHHHGIPEIREKTTMQQNQKKDVAARKTMSNSQAFKMQEEERAKKPKIVFLDVDGVLHSIRVTRQEQLFNAQKMGLLRRILNASGAQIVLSSAWRRTAPTLRMAYAMLQKHGIATPIDITPDYGLCGKRSAEILTWVDKYQIKDWIAIDDMDLNAGEPRMRPHFIKCNPLVGLTNDLVEQSINILNKHDHQSHSEVDQLVAKALNVHGGAGVAGTNTNMIVRATGTAAPTQVGATT